MNGRQITGWKSIVSLLGLLVGLMATLGEAEARLECYDCHGTRVSHDNRPLDAAERDIATGGFRGNHRNILPEGADKNNCAVCHPGSGSYTPSHRDGKITLAFKLNSSIKITPYSSHSSAFFQSAVPILGSCSNVNCHFESPTQSWGSPALARNACDQCHETPPTDGAHVKKHGEYYGSATDSCRKCHTDHVAEVDPLAHAREAGTRPLTVAFGSAPNSGGTYNGDVSYPHYLPSQNPTRNGSCTNLYCHSDGRGGAAAVTVKWSDKATTKCYSCHLGRTADSTEANCSEILGNWSSAKGACAPSLTMKSNGHARLTGPQWIRKYSCYYCHDNTVDAAGTVKDKSKHLNGMKDIAISSQWAIVGPLAPSYDLNTKVCSNIYCHSDGTTNPEQVRPFAWTEPKTECNTCHGHPKGSCSNVGCHDGRTDEKGKIWSLKTGWPAGQEWKAAIPMFRNQGAGTARANSHARHVETTFTCDECHAATVLNGTCTNCHAITSGAMSEVAHLNGAYHVNKTKDVVFKQGGSYDAINKTCSNTACHSSGTDPQWGGAVVGAVICLSCHGTTGPDLDDFGAFNGVKSRINLTEWVVAGHGRYSTAGRYPSSNNPAANFPGNPCWYCHDNNVLHKDDSNPFRLRLHPQFAQRFAKECVYCHMERLDSECISCHVAQAESLSPQATGNGVVYKKSDGSFETKYPAHTYLSGCIATGCHDSDSGTFSSGAQKGHDANAGVWTKEQMDDVKNQYMMMGVCLQCHDDDSGGKCTSCHTPPANNLFKYSLGFDPGTGFIKPKVARATSSHFGYKHYKYFQSSGGWTKDANGKVTGTWKGGKFCWDCHDPHGDKNIYMIQNKVATTTDGTFGKPITRSDVVFTRKQSGLDYARNSAPYNGICNVCHSAGSQHFRSDGGDGHNASRVCTTCHEHRFSDSHGDQKSCSTCHFNKPVPRHSGFGLPRDCTKCHGGTIGLRMDVMGQFRANSHHVQDVDVTNKQCYQCHWEATPDGLIDTRYHEGYNYKTYSTVKNAKVDLVVWKAGVRPTWLNTTTAVQFVASKMGGSNAVSRAESAKLNNHCISCHSDQNNDATPFGDCKTPRQYAWDRQSIDARYSQKGTATWGKYPSTAGAAQKNIPKALSAHGNAVSNQGGWSTTTGLDGTITNTRTGGYNVNCFDCHSSHGSKATGTTSSYVTFNGTKNGGNLKETQAGKGGYSMSYKATANPAGINPYNVGAGQCFDCHLTQTAGTTPWGYQSTFGASVPIMGYKDTMRFDQGTKASTARFSERVSRATIVGGHLKASSPLSKSAAEAIDGLCTPCHDPHGVSTSLGTDQAYAVPLLKGTWMTSPYKEDSPAPNPSGSTSTSLSWGRYQGHPSVLPISNYNIDRTTFGGSTRITETDEKFAGLCLKCHLKGNLTDGTNKNQTWKSIDRVHESVKGWGANTEHSYSCSKCHEPHNSGLPRLMQTDCLDYKHRGSRVSGGQAWQADSQSGSAHGHSEHRGYPNANVLGNVEASSSCHTNAPLNSGSWPDKNLWNNKTLW